ncbi:hypothetical protein HH214_06885 [Mucilaginibacter robiniae]|uniref:DUF1682 domain-containing protein n=1 Tax=Mucilaginibacter robiniae TaxID=2728022 RepID=A0A7L5E1Y4_9SPHI|nr:hypothetical protein [Mucilaginibacter robiniae]QJD95614.1 hypothetical protein HH214_06885 [Mucilaginibacter robiniae]
MRKIFYKGRFIFVPIIAAAFLTIISFIVMQLWNNLLPDILHVSTITFWQAMGIFILCKILFGFGRGGRFGGGTPWMRNRMAEKFKNMSPEDREKFREQFSRHRCGPRGRWGWDEPKTEDKAMPSSEENL